MKWYVAHIVMQVTFKKGEQTYFPVWESMYLIHACSDEEAEEKANKIGLEQEGDARGSFFWEERAAYWKFIGVRKLILVSGGGVDLVDGCDLSYLQFQLDSKKDVVDYMSGEDVKLLIQK